MTDESHDYETFPVIPTGCICQGDSWKDSGVCDMHYRAGRGKYVAL